MIEILFAILIGWTFDRAQMMISASNYSTVFNGFGAIDLTVKKQIKAPMAYRVLVPFLVSWIEQTFKVDAKYRVFIYQNLKAFFVILAAYSVIHVFGIVTALITFLILLLTIQFDYWDWPIELAAVVFASGGHFVPALLLGILFAFSRETAPITGFIYWIASGDLAGGIIISGFTVLLMLGVRIFVGKRELYCKRVMWKDNLILFKNFLKWKPFAYSPLFVTSAITAGTLISVIVNPHHWYSLIFIIAGWILAKADEPRVFSAVVPFISLMIGGSL